MTYNADERAYLWLCACTKTDYRERVALLRAHSPLDLLERAEELFPALVHEPQGKFSPSRAEREREADGAIGLLAEKDAFAVTLLSSDYPEALKHISLPPLVLYGAGRRELLQMRKFCVVGSRIIPPWAAKTGRAISEELSSRFAVVTGLAEGGDLAAVEGAVKSGNLICVLPCGLDECYPAAHAAWKETVRKSGLLLTECSFGQTAMKFSFHARNRLLAGLSEGVLVLSAAKRSGTLITANYALDAGRDVFALPHNVGAAQGEGCNELIKQGAYLATDAGDILSVYGMERRESGQTELSPDEAKTLRILRDLGEVHLAELAARADMKIYEVSALLSALELKGLAVKSGGNKYSAV